MSDSSLELDNEVLNDHLPVHIDDLSEDCILAIFALLTNVREKLRLKRVCKRWLMLCTKSIYYHHTRLTDVEDVYYENEIKNLQDSLNKSNCDNLMDVDLYKYQISLSHIFSNYRNLKVFHIVKNPSFVYMIYDWNLKNDNLNNFNLLEIKIVNDNQLTDSLLSTLVQKCPKLETINLVNCVNLNGDFLYYVISNLKNLRLNQCQIDTRKLNNWITNYGKSIVCFEMCCRSVDIRSILMSINNSCLQIKELSLKDQILASFSNWSLIGKLNLKTLSIALDTVDDEIICSIVNCDLETLEIELSDEYLSTADRLTCFRLFASLLPKLKHLTLINIHQIDMTYFSCLTDLKHLQSITLINCYNLSNLFVQFLQRIKLQKITLTNCLQDIDKDQIKHLAHQNQIDLVIN